MWFNNKMIVVIKWPKISVIISRISFKVIPLCFLFFYCDNPVKNIETFTLTISTSNGIVSTVPNKPRYSQGEIVTLIAIESGNYSFLKWSQDANGTNETTKITMDDNKCITADFFPLTLTDIDGNIYHTVKIGSQVWTKENIRTTTFTDGTPIFKAPAGSWSEDDNGTPIGYCYYNNTTNIDSIIQFGALYSWKLENIHTIAPTGWHVPTWMDWDSLKCYLITHGYNYDETTDLSVNNKIAKSLSANKGWTPSAVTGAIGNNLNNNNSSGFSALPGGGRSLVGSYDGSSGSVGYWWYSDFRNGTSLRFDNASLCFLNDFDFVNFATRFRSIRLIRDAM